MRRARGGGSRRTARLQPAEDKENRGEERIRGMQGLVEKSAVYFNEENLTAGLPKTV